MWLLAAREVSPSPLLPSCAISAGQGGKSQPQLMSLQIQPTISASSEARKDFAKLHIRQLLRTLVFCLYQPENAVCLAACLPLCLCDPHIKPVALLFPEVTRTCSEEPAFFFGTSVGSPEGFATGRECPSVSASSKSCVF